MNAGFLADLTFDLDGRRSNRTGRGFKRFSMAMRRRFDFLATFLATSALAPKPQAMGALNRQAAAAAGDLGARIASSVWFSRCRWR
jgi:hypothetical protein